MLRSRLIHPEILAGLAEAGHGAQVLIADGNYSVATNANPAARLVFLNLEPGRLTATEVLDVVAEAIPVEEAFVMAPAEGPEPAIFGEFRSILPGVALQGLGRREFYELARQPDCALAIATGEQRHFGNIIVTIGVVPAE